MMTKETLTALILEKKAALSLTWEAIAAGIGLSPVFAVSACLGMNSLKEEPAQKLVTLLDLPAEAKVAVMDCPTKVWDKAIPTDPLIYRFYEVIGVYGPTIKSLIHEKFGDGIMSAIDFSMDIQREPNPQGDRVRVVLSGKFLPYKDY